MGHLLPPGGVFAFLAGHRRELFPDELFAGLFRSARGRPSVPADVFATVIVLQSLHGLSDRDAAEAVTFDLRWKAAAGLAVEASSFHATTLTYWRRRLADSRRPNRIFELVRQVVAETGVLKGKTRRALDSTVLDDAVATQDTVTQLIAAIRRVRRDVPEARALVEEVCSAHDYDDAGKPAIAWDDEAARAALVDGLVADAHRLLGHLPELERDSKQAESLALLALIAGQDVEWIDDDCSPVGGSWRIARRVAEDRVISVVDPDARHAHKTVARRQDGFKAHVAVEPDTGIVTGVAGALAAGLGQRAFGYDVEGAGIREVPAHRGVADGEERSMTVAATKASGAPTPSEAMTTAARPPRWPAAREDQDGQRELDHTHPPLKPHPGCPGTSDPVPSPVLPSTVLALMSAPPSVVLSERPAPRCRGANRSPGTGRNVEEAVDLGRLGWWPCGQTSCVRSERYCRARAITTGMTCSVMNSAVSSPPRSAAQPR